MKALHLRDFPRKLMGFESLNLIPVLLLRKRMFEFGLKSTISSLQFCLCEVRMFISSLFTRIVRSSFSLWVFKSTKKFFSAPVKVLFEQLVQVRFFMILLVTAGQDFDISVSKLDSIVFMSTPTGRTFNTSWGINFSLPLDLFNFTIKDLVKQKEQRFSLILVSDRGHLSCSKLFQTARGLIKVRSFCSSWSFVLAYFGPLGGFPPPLSFNFGVWWSSCWLPKWKL